MNIYLQQGREKLQWLIRALHRFWLIIKRLLQEQFNKNLYTRILFTNITAFVIALIVLVIFSSFVVKQVTYDQVQQEWKQFIMWLLLINPSSLPTPAIKILEGVSPITLEIFSHVWL